MAYKYDPDDFYEGDKVKIIVHSLYKGGDEPELIYEGQVDEIEGNGFWWHEEGSDKQEFSSFADIQNVMYKPAWWAEKLAARNITAGCRINLELEDSEHFKCRIASIEEDWLSTRTNDGARCIHLNEVKEIKLLSDPLEKVQYVADFLTEEQYAQFEALADDYETSIGSILQAFVQDLLQTEQSGGSDERDMAREWFDRNCIGREFVRS